MSYSQIQKGNQGRIQEEVIKRLLSSGLDPRVNQYENREAIISLLIDCLDHVEQDLNFRVLKLKDFGLTSVRIDEFMCLNFDTFNLNIRLCLHHHLYRIFLSRIGHSKKRDSTSGITIAMNPFTDNERQLFFRIFYHRDSYCYISCVNGDTLLKSDDEIIFVDIS